MYLGTDYENLYFYTKFTWVPSTSYYKQVLAYNWIGILQSYSKLIKCGQMAIPISFVAKWPFLFFLWLVGHSYSWLPQYYCIPYQIGYRVGEGLVSKC